MNSAYDDAASEDLRAQVASERMRMLCSQVPTLMATALGFSLALVWLLEDEVDPTALWWWFGLRTVLITARFVQARLYMKAGIPQHPFWYHSFLALLGLDGVLWGATWWWLVPLDRFPLTAVTLTAILGIAALAAFILHADGRATLVHVVPLLVPNIVYSLSRHDAYGVFGSISLATFTVFLIVEARRAQGRLLELLTLRFLHERVLQEREQALALAQHHSETKSRFLASMSHEMRTPLHGILGLARLLHDDEIRPVAQRRLELLERSGEHLLTVINDVLDVSKIEAGHVQIEQRPFNLSALIDEVAGVSTVTANRKGLRLHADIGLPRQHVVVGDAMRVRQILHNLLGNAIKFTDHGSVTLRVGRIEGGSQISFVVEDTGIGISESEQAHIFDAFHQVDNALDKRHGGTGLGLTISRQLCQAMGGDLRCRSERGHGSSFECLLDLPATLESPDDAAIDTREPAAEQTRPVLSGVVLLVEDNPINAMVAEAALRQIGVCVHTVDDGRKALDWLTDHRPDLVLMDCQMPVMDGFEAARRIRDQELRLGQRRVPIIALTANVFPGERQGCSQAGMDDYLGKPFRREDLHRMLLNHMGRHASSAQEAPQRPSAAGFDTDCGAAPQCSPG